MSGPDFGIYQNSDPSERPSEGGALKHALIVFLQAMLLAVGLSWAVDYVWQILRWAVPGHGGA